MKRRMLVAFICVGLLSSCSSRTSVLDESVLEGGIGPKEDIMYDRVALDVAKDALPFTVPASSFLPYKPKEDGEAIIRKVERENEQNISLTIKYNRMEGEEKSYVELTVANFAYSMPLMLDRQLFDEEITLKDGTSAYFKGSKADIAGEDFASLTWKKRGMEYQLIYRYVQGNETVKQSLLHMANSLN